MVVREGVFQRDGATREMAGREFRNFVNTILENIL
jgi:hypothetical protein